MEAILPIILKAVNIATAVWDNRDLAFRAIESVKRIIEVKDMVTDAELDAVAQELDSLLEEFNRELHDAQQVSEASTDDDSRR